jgi:hypothetical protein
MLVDEREILMENVLRPERRRTTVEERLQVFEDKERIRDLIMEYAFLCDADMHDELYDRYTDDVERHLGGTLTETVRGKAEVRHRQENPILQRQPGMPGPPTASQGMRDQIKPRHLMSTAVVKLSDDSTEAWASVYFSLASLRDWPSGTSRGIHDGGYLFAFRKEAEDWKISKLMVFTEIAHDVNFQD